jgi:hypothetical protein
MKLETRDKHFLITFLFGLAGTILTCIGTRIEWFTWPGVILLAIYGILFFYWEYPEIYGIKKQTKQDE